MIDPTEDNEDPNAPKPVTPAVPKLTPASIPAPTPTPVPTGGGAATLPSTPTPVAPPSDATPLPAPPPATIPPPLASAPVNVPPPNVDPVPTNVPQLPGPTPVSAAPPTIGEPAAPLPPTIVSGGAGTGQPPVYAPVAASAPPTPSATQTLQTAAQAGAAAAGQATGGTTGRSANDTDIHQAMQPIYAALGTSAGVGTDNQGRAIATVPTADGSSQIQYTLQPDGSWTSDPNGSGPKLTSDQLKQQIAGTSYANVAPQNPSSAIVAGVGPTGNQPGAGGYVDPSGNPIVSGTAPTPVSPFTGDQTQVSFDGKTAGAPPPLPQSAIGGTDTGRPGPTAVAGGTRTPAGPTDTGGSVVPTGATIGTPNTPTPAGPTDTGAGSQPTNTATLQGALGSAVNPVTGSTTATTPYTPDNNLIDKTLSVGPTADRFKIAQSQFDASAKASDPTYQASLRDALREAAAGGGLGSGQLNTSIGDLANNRNLQLDTQRTQFLNDALTGSINDAYANEGIASQQQGFQAGRADTAFTQAAAQANLQDTLKNSDFNRNLQTLLAGEQGDPATIDLALSNIFGSQASAAGSALASLIKGTAAGDAGSSKQLMDMIQSEITRLKGGGTGAGAGTASSPTGGAPVTSGGGGWTDNGDGTWTGPDGGRYTDDGAPAL